MARGTKQAKDERLVIRCSTEFKEEISAAAVKLDVEVSAFVRDAIKEKLGRMNDNLFWNKLGRTLRERAKEKNIDLASLGFDDSSLPTLRTLMPECAEADRTLFSILSTAFSQMNEEV